jgi:hypothetical protein
LAAEVVLGQSVLCRLLDLALEHAVANRPVVVYAREEEHKELRLLAVGSNAPNVVFVDSTPAPDAAVLRTDLVYDSARLRRGLRRGRSPESAVVWRLDRPESLAAAGDELTRRLTYQPLGKYWAFPLARWLADRLAPTSIRPNALTLGSGALMLSAAALVAAGPERLPWRFASALALAVALVLDTADGRLARLQGTGSAFGRWLDQVLDELADVALHAAIAWAAFCRGSNATWLVAGIAYASGKYMFLVQSLAGDELERKSSAPQLSRAVPDSEGDSNGRARFARLVRMVGHADLRWHLWIVLAFVGRLEYALAAYAGYFAMRAVAGAVRKGAQYA